MNKIRCLVVITAAVLCTWPFHLTAAPSSQQISIFQANMQSHQQDLLGITTAGKSAIGRDDAEIAINLVDLVHQYSIQLEHIQDLLLISAVVQDPGDKKRIKPVIDRAVKAVADRVEISLKQLNLSIAHAKHQGIIATAVRLRDHLRDLKGILQGAN